MYVRPHYFAAAALIAMLSGTPAFADVSFKGGDGHAFETAIVIFDVEGKKEAIAAEHGWFAEHRPGWDFSDHKLVKHEDHSYDVYEITKGYDKETFYFDVTAYHGAY
jgi:hypothetical protein